MTWKLRKSALAFSVVVFRRRKEGGTRMVGGVKRETAAGKFVSQ